MSKMKPISVNQFVLKKPMLCPYASSGIGKTSLLKSLTPEQQKRTLFIDAELGMGSVSDTAISMLTLARDENGVKVEEHHRLPRLLEINKYVVSPDARSNFDILFIDSFTEIAQNVKSYCEKELKLTGWEMWGTYNTFLFDLLKFYRDLDSYTIVITFLEDRVDEEGQASFYQPLIQGKQIQNAIMPIFDGVYRIVVHPETGVRSFVTNPTLRTKAKDRYGVLDAVEPASLSLVLEKIENKRIGEKKNV